MTYTDVSSNPAALAKLIADIEAVVAHGGTEEVITAEVAEAFHAALTIDQDHGHTAIGYSKGHVAGMASEGFAWLNAR